MKLLVRCRAYFALLTHMLELCVGGCATGSEGGAAGTVWRCQRCVLRPAFPATPPPRLPQLASLAPSACIASLPFPCYPLPTPASPIRTQVYPERMAVLPGGVFQTLMSTLQFGVGATGDDEVTQVLPPCYFSVRVLRQDSGAAQASRSC